MKEPKLDRFVKELADAAADGDVEEIVVAVLTKDHPTPSLLILGSVDGTMSLISYVGYICATRGGLEIHDVVKKLGRVWHGMKEVEDREPNMGNPGQNAAMN